MATGRLSGRAESDLKRLPEIYLRAVAVALRELRDEPLRGKLLKGEYAGLRSHRVGTYRTIYHFSPKDQLVMVASVEHRGAAYRR